MTPVQVGLSQIFAYCCTGAVVILPVVLIVRVLLLTGARAPGPGAITHRENRNAIAAVEPARLKRKRKVIKRVQTEEQQIITDVRRWILHGARED